MFNYQKLILTSFLISSVSFVYAQVDVHGSMPVKIKMANGHERVIQLFKMKLDQNNRRILSDNVSFQISRPKRLGLSRSLGESQYDIGMNGVPVMDQGVWGTCATFAATAAIDAYLKLNDENSVSQLCNLQLGRSIKNPDKEGGWEGSFGHLVLDQISNYGFINKSFQHQNGCGGLNHYPVDDSVANGNKMKVATFNAISDKRFSYHNWKPLLSYNNQFKPISTLVGSRVLMGVKKALLSKHRVVFGTLLAPFTGQAGAVGDYKQVKNDVWVLTPEIRHKINSGTIAGHEMVIVGFDDNACATYTDAEGKEQQQCGLLHLRNSWSEFAGDHGDYYVTYDYFKTMTIEAYEVGGDLR